MIKRSNLTRLRLILAAVLLATGVALVALGAWGYFSDGTPGETAAEAREDPTYRMPVAIPYYNPAPAAEATAEPTPSPTTNAPTVRMTIETIDVDAPVVTMGLEDGGIPEVPLNGEDVAWYDFSTRPGEGSNAVFAAHVTWSKAPAVFWDLKELKEGDTIRLAALDGTEYVYRVFASYEVDPDDPDSLKVMAPTDRDIVTLITCGGTWVPDPSERFGGDYTARLIVQAELV